MLLKLFCYCKKFLTNNLHSYIQHLWFRYFLRFAGKLASWEKLLIVTTCTDLPLRPLIKRAFECADLKCPSDIFDGSHSFRITHFLNNSNLYFRGWCWFRYNMFNIVTRFVDQLKQWFSKVLRAGFIGENHQANDF